VFDLFGVEGEVKLVELDERAGTARYKGHWAPAA
jgi:hypothetical protein